MKKMNEIIVNKEEIELGDKYFNFWPYKYQQLACDYLLFNEYCMMEITAGTGVGKTAITAFAILKKYLDKNIAEAALLLYPTNALIDDQARSIQNLANKFNVEISIEKITTEELVSEILFTNIPKRTVLRGKIGGRFQKPKFVLTNPDIFHLIVQRYYGVRKGGWQSEGLFQEFYPFDYLVLDEFHLYEGRMLSLLFLDLAIVRVFDMFPRIVFLTATPDKLTRSYIHKLAIIGNKMRVKEDIKPDKITGTQKHITNYKVTFQFFDLNFDYLNQIKEWIANNKEVIESLRQQNSLNSYVPATIIINSVIAARRLTQNLQKQFPTFKIIEIHGMVPANLRKFDAATHIIVGTSAIEVGIDFNSSILVFTANSASNAIQRFGRIGRHNQGIAIALLPKYVVNFIQKNSTLNMSRKNFLFLLANAFVENKINISQAYFDGPFVLNDANLYQNKLFAHTTKPTSVENTKLADKITNALKILYNIKSNDARLCYLSRIAPNILLKQFIALRGQQIQVLVYDYSSESSSFFPFYFAPLSRILNYAKITNVYSDKSFILNYIASKKKKGNSFFNDNFSIIQNQIDAGYYSRLITITGYTTFHSITVIVDFHYKHNNLYQVKMISSLFDDDVPNVRPLIDNTINSKLESIFLNLPFVIIKKALALQLPWQIEKYKVDNSDDYIVFGTDSLIILSLYWQ